MQKNLMKAKLREGKPVLGGICRLAYPTSIEAMGYAGLDWVLIDSEHGSMGFETAEVMSMYAYATGVTPIMRVHTLSESLIMRALDIGAQGVLVPHVCTAEDAKLVADAAHYLPKGTRGVGPGRGTRFGAIPAAEYFAMSNEEVITLVMIEDAEAIDNIEAIAAVEGIHILNIGTSDLSQSLGVSGDFKHPKVLDAIEKTRAAADKYGKWVAFPARSKAEAAECVKAGYHATIVGTDTSILRAGFADIVETAKG